jgi:hypothetical protein
LSWAGTRYSDAINDELWTEFVDRYDAADIDWGKDRLEGSDDPNPDPCASLSALLPVENPKRFGDASVAVVSELPPLTYLGRREPDQLST